MRKCEVADMKSLKLNKTTRRNYLTYLLVILAYVILQVLPKLQQMGTSWPVRERLREPEALRAFITTKATMTPR